MPHISSQLDYNSLTPLPEANDPSIVAYIFAQPALTYPNQNVSEKVYKNEMWIPNRSGFDRPFVFTFLTRPIEVGSSSPRDEDQSMRTSISS